jgi:hypothetical protein
MRQAYLRFETAQQEKRVLEHEVGFLKDVLRAKGLLPERDGDNSKIQRDKNGKNKRTRSDAAIKSQAIVIE